MSISLVNPFFALESNNQAEKDLMTRKRVFEFHQIIWSHGSVRCSVTLYMFVLVSANHCKSVSRPSRISSFTKDRELRSDGGPRRRQRRYCRPLPGLPRGEAIPGGLALWPSTMPLLRIPNPRLPSLPCSQRPSRISPSQRQRRNPAVPASIRGV